MKMNRTNPSEAVLISRFVFIRRAMQTGWMAALLALIVWLPEARSQGLKLPFTVDRIYRNDIRSVQLFPAMRSPDARLQPPIIPLQQPVPLVLVFDQMGDDADYFIARIVHCNADWKPSSFQPLDYLTEFNEFNINQFEFSIGTKVPYVNFSFQLPRVKMSGNYLVRVFKKGSDREPVLEKGFVVFENLVEIGAKILPVTGGQQRDVMQQVDFSAFYPNVNLEFPETAVRAVVRQNYRWDNAIRELKPLYVRQNTRQLDFRYFNFENAFTGGNEFRVFEFPDIATGGLNVQRVVAKPAANEVYLYPEILRGDKAYNQQQRDQNGRFMVFARMINNPDLEADYCAVHFFLQSANPLPNEVYVVGGFSNWQVQAENRMEYVAEAGGYAGAVLLKQGSYDYMFAQFAPLSGKLDTSATEGDFQLAENSYEVILYYRAPASRGDRVIGYFRTTSR